MDVFGQLESRVEQLLERLDALNKENASLRAALACERDKNDNLARDNNSLRESLRKAEAKRVQALGRMEALLRKIQDYNSVG